MKTVIVDKEDITLDVKSKALFVDTQRVPMQLIEMLILNHTTQLDSKILINLSRENIAVLMVSKNSQDFALTLPQVAKNSEQKIQQYRALENRLGYAKYFIHAKIQTHSKHLEEIGVQINESEWQEKVSNAEKISDLLGYEGSFSRLYFQHYFASIPKVLHKSKRTKRPPEDPVNAMLSYLYSIAYNVITAQLYKAGLDPAISYLHEAFRSHYALSSDVLELFRAKINALVALWFNEKKVELEDFSRKNGIYLRYESRKKLWVEIKEICDYIAKETTKEIALLKVAMS